MNNFVLKLQPFNNLRDEFYFLLLTIILLDNYAEDYRVEQKETAANFDEENLNNAAEAFWKQADKLFQQVS